MLSIFTTLQKLKTFFLFKNLTLEGQDSGSLICFSLSNFSIASSILHYQYPSSFKNHKKSFLSKVYSRNSRLNFSKEPSLFKPELNFATPPL